MDANRTITIGYSDAKERFFELLDEVEMGSEITITRNEEAIAKLMPLKKTTHVDLGDLFRKMDEFGKKYPLNKPSQNGTTYRDLIEGGRRR